MNRLRQFYRIRYPEQLHPMLFCHGQRFRIIDLSETGACVLVEADPNWVQPVPVTVKFPDGTEFRTSAIQVRSFSGRIGIQFSPQVPFGRILSEQRRLRRHFRHLME